ncbi:Guanine/hypoxanthine permease PbuO [Paenibacillus konkukensis]|uniref:Guanine/hypoxanthine permease PbuO n=1 Tax=Paenibacillus konkukensis TaxID=2020716 RepID=A0ABY4RPE4_9BACL|nr:NCS2 family permease [Paenibacillus konkukensis]UQZ83212.1 Guanine/hypoxanthine permease PbuO [Paenibacillus konkukensis]
MSKQAGRPAETGLSRSPVRKELLAGVVSFFTIVYIIAVNSSILEDAGIPLEAGIIATALTSFAGCMLMGLWADAPIILVPGMGINALFTYTVVQTMGLSWQEALGAVCVSGLLFALVAFTPLAQSISQSIPDSLKEATTVGIGLFLTFIGLQKGGIVVSSATTFVALGDFADPHTALTLATLLVALVLHVRNVPGGFLITIAAGTALAIGFGQVSLSEAAGGHVSPQIYLDVIGALSFASIASASFWIAAFTLALVIVFENIGMIHSHLRMAGEPQKFARSLQANAVSVITAGIFGTSPTVSTAESAAGISAGGSRGLTAITTGLLFLISIFCIPVIKLIPDSAIAPILMIVGGLMSAGIQRINFAQFGEGFPAFLIIALIPLTYSIVDGMAFGFMAYVVLKLAQGKAKDISLPLYLIAGLFLINFIFHAIG